MSNRKKVLYIANTSPYYNSHARENLDLVMMLASFDVDVSILFRGHGILQLLETEHEIIQARAFTPILKSLEHYDITKLYVTDEALAQFEISQKQLICPVTVIDAETLKNLFQQFDYIF